MEDSFSNGLRALRQQRGWSVRALAQRSSVSSVWITLVENGHRSIGLAAIDKLAAGLGLREPELTRFRLSGLALSQRSDLLKGSHRYGPTLNNALAIHLRRQGIRPTDIAETHCQPELGEEDLARLMNALEHWAQVCQAGRQNVGTRSADGPFLEIRLKDGGRAWCALLVTGPQSKEPQTGAASSAARNPPRPLIRATGNRRNQSTLNDQENTKSDPR